MIYGSDVNSVDRQIEIAPGHRVRSLGVVDLSPSDAVRQGIFRALSSLDPTGSCRHSSMATRTARRFYCVASTVPR